MDKTEVLTWVLLLASLLPSAATFERILVWVIAKQKPAEAKEIENKTNCHSKAKVNISPC